MASRCFSRCALEMHLLPHRDPELSFFLPLQIKHLTEMRRNG